MNISGGSLVSGRWTLLSQLQEDTASFKMGADSGDCLQTFSPKHAGSGPYQRRQVILSVSS